MLPRSPEITGGLPHPPSIDMGAGYPYQSSGSCSKYFTHRPSSPALRGLGVNRKRGAGELVVEEVKGGQEKICPCVGVALSKDS